MGVETQQAEGGRSAAGPRSPESYPRRVLVTVSGLTPQIITETLYALAVREPAFVPTEVRVITTEAGRKRFVANIEQFRAFFREYELPVPRCDAGDVLVVAGPDGRATDVRTPEDNEHVGNLILQTVLELTADPDCAVHASIAGGRKTMGFYLGYLMSMFGREQDRISHVLVHEDVESLPGFFYPPRDGRALVTADGRSVVVDRGSVLLSEIPFIRHRSGFSDEDLRRGGMTFQQAVERAQRSVHGTHLVIDVAARRVLAGGVEVPLEASPFAFLVWAAEARLTGVEALRYSDAPRALLGWYRRALRRGEMAKFEETQRALRHGFGEDDFRYRVHTVNRAFRRVLGAGRSRDYELKLLRKGSGRYSLSLGAEDITLRLGEGEA